ncbi:HD-GYP domain-containing protein [Hippea maritima]|uniref:Metal dependent phosphohydrolase n=1 Tax=Hippea maritima (strain ATCC 700847 / DSM 10411 / MH2) TaxID=760142 RepID=F2LV16_HIPMA|nr:HD domain-containing phosphohydrolase [Hippea maritima]AEA33600.1 metal dependent phosphohydrolase [Hippea maritima DSM 10411]
MVSVGGFDFMHTYVRLHGNLVAYYANTLCRAFGISPRKVVFAAYFHDYGKYKWDYDLFTKPELSEEDWEEIKKHPKESVEIVLKMMPERKDLLLEGSPSILDLIYLHHEKPDGSGYYGVKDIPVESAIISISDIFDSCVSDRPYRKTMSDNDAIEIALQLYGGYLDLHGYSSDVAREVLKKSVTKITILSTAG